MLRLALNQIKSALLLFILITLITGIIYPGFITVFAQIFFPWQANGSLITIKDEKVGSKLIGQSFTKTKYFWGRPSATKPFPYNSQNSTGSNYAAANINYIFEIRERVENIKKTDPSNPHLIPVDLVTASGSGLDPEISPFAAFYQISRVAKARRLSNERITELVQSHIQPRSFGALGEPRVNVLLLNIALDNLKEGK